MPEDNQNNNGKRNGNPGFSGLSSSGAAAERRRKQLAEEARLREKEIEEEEERRRREERAREDLSKSKSGRHARAPKKEKSRRKPGAVAGFLGKSAKAAGAVLREYWKPFLAFFFEICAVAAAVLLILILPNGGKTSLPDKITVEEFGKKTASKYSLFVENGELYVDADRVFSYFGASYSGDKNSMTVVTVPGESAKFTNGSDVAVLNGETVHMGAPAVIRNYKLRLPLSFYKVFVTGGAVDWSEDAKTLAISADDGAEVGFRIKGGIAMTKIPLDPNQISIIIDDVNLSYKFVNDLSGYSKFMNPENRDDYLLLISPAKPDDGSYVPPNLISVLNGRPGYTNLSLEATAEKALEALFIEMHSAGFTGVYVNMAYRSFSDQKKTYDNYVYNERTYYRYNYETTKKYFSDTAYRVLGSAYLQSTYISKGVFSLSLKDAERVVSTYSAVPGTGDHQTGLGVDMHDLKKTDVSFAERDAYRWLCENAYKFGFIERFPEGKEKITGFAYEPYHWRFVGQYHAAKMHESGMCLEEYIASLE